MIGQPRQVFAVGLAILLAAVVSAMAVNDPDQTGCGLLLLEEPRLVSDTSSGYGELLFPLELKLDQITTEAASARRSDRHRVVGHDDVRAVGAEMHASIMSDSSAMYLAAEALSRIMRGEAAGSSAEQAVVASDLYDAWALPSRPALVVLSDPNESMRARALAVYALRRYWKTEPFHAAALRGACSLAVRAGAVRLAVGPRVRLGIERVLNEDEMDLLEWLTRSLEAGLTKQQWAQLRFEKTLLPDNPVTIELRQSLDSDP